MSEDLRVDVDGGKYTLVVEDTATGPAMRLLR